MNGQVTVPTVALHNRVSFFDRRSDFRRLVVRGALLEFVTVGFYRFWLATDIRRLLWSHTSVDGDAAEYTGTAKELFLGFLIALAILVPIYLAYFLIGLEAERWQAFASTPLAIIARSWKASTKCSMPSFYPLAKATASSPRSLKVGLMRELPIPTRATTKK